MGITSETSEIDFTQLIDNKQNVKYFLKFNKRSIFILIWKIYNKFNFFI